MRVSSASLAGSRGGGIDVDSFSSWMARAVSADIFWPSKRLACSIQRLSCPSQRSLALEASSWLSSLI
jgi:hypothetical protein